MTSHQRKGLFVVRRINWFTEPHGCQREPAVHGTHMELLRTYRGVEGEAWPEDALLGDVRIIEGLVSLGHIETVRAYVGKLRQLHPDSVIDCIYCEIHPTLPDRSSPGAFLGYDAGYLECETNVYSVVYNEVVYGKYSDLRAVGQKLNAQLLLPAMEAVDSLQQIRENLLRSKADLETDQECVPIAVFDPDLLR